jgi:phospholipid transport system substrate-binding protein
MAPPFNSTIKKRKDTIMRANVSKIIMAILFSLILLPASAAAQTEPPLQGATQQLKTTLTDILNVLLDPTLRQEQHKAQRMEKVRALFRQRFAEHTFCMRTLGSQWKKLSKAEQNKFVLLFSDLLINTYLGRIDGYLTGNTSFSHQSIAYHGERATKTYTLVTTGVLIDQSKIIPVLYRMETIDGTWKITDIAIEGISLLRNYRAQFNEIIANAGYDELLKRLKAKQV